MLLKYLSFLIILFCLHIEQIEGQDLLHISNSFPAVITIGKTGNGIIHIPRPPDYQLFDVTDIADINKDGFDKTGYDKDGYDIRGFDENGFDMEGYNVKGEYNGSIWFS